MPCNADLEVNRQQLAQCVLLPPAIAAIKIIKSILQHPRTAIANIRIETRYLRYGAVEAILLARSRLVRVRGWPGSDRY